MMPSMGLEGASGPAVAPPADTVPAEKVYQALLAAPRGVGAAEVARSESLTVADTTLALEYLATLKLAHQVDGPDGSPLWRAVSPDVASARRQLDTENEVRRMRSEDVQAAEAAAAFRRVYQEVNTQAVASSQVEVLVDGHAVMARVASLMHQVVTSVEEIHPTMAPVEVLEAGFELDRSLLARGVQYRSVWPHTARRQPDSMAYMQRLLDLGAKIRTTAFPPSRMILLDRRVALIPLPAAMGTGAALVREPVVMDYLTQSFEYTWERSSEANGPEYDPDIFADLDKAILDDMLRGRTDEAIARRLGISTRTLRRYIATIASKLGVDSRFQMALAARKAGLLATDDVNLAPLVSEDPQ